MMLSRRLICISRGPTCASLAWGLPYISKRVFDLDIFGTKITEKYSQEALSISGMVSPEWNFVYVSNVK